MSVIFFCPPAHVPCNYLPFNCGSCFLGSIFSVKIKSGELSCLTCGLPTVISKRLWYLKDHAYPFACLYFFLECGVPVGFYFPKVIKILIACNLCNAFKKWTLFIY